jgi:hypothetical protein
MSTTPSLRERLLEAFGEDLPIHGGSGLESAPIVVTAGDLQDAVDVQTRVLHWLGRGSGAAWRLTGLAVVEPEHRVVRATIESIVARGHEVVAHKEAIYFVLEALPTDAATMSLPAPSGFVDPRSGVQLPIQLGWLHLSHATDNEPGSPGLGWSVTYESLAIKGTVYVYARGERLDTDDVESARVVEEFRSAVADALDEHPGAEIKHQAIFRDAAGRGQCRLAILDLPGDSMSAVLLTALNGVFVKARMTFDTAEREFGRMAHESMQAFVDAIQRTR